MITVSFYSYKGGVGRSLTVANLGLYLAQFGATVALLDMDLEAPGLQYKLASNEPCLETRDLGLASLLASASSGRVLDDADFAVGEDVTQQLDASIADQGGRVILVPAGDPRSATYWSDTAAIDWAGLFSESKRGVHVLEQLKRSLEERFKPDFLLVDSRTGITSSGGVATTLLPDVVVTLLLNSPEHVDGTRMVIDSVRSGDPSFAPRVVPVLSRYTEPAIEPQRAGLASNRFREDVAADVSERRKEELERAISELRRNITTGLDEAKLAGVSDPFVLRSDLELQRNETLAFGVGPRKPRVLADDYVRLFAAIVPREEVEKYFEGVRSYARQNLLDKPEEAIRSLEHLAELSGDQQLLADLIKICALRQDEAGAIEACDRLFQLHGVVFESEFVTRAIQRAAIESGRHRTNFRRRTGSRELDAEFALAYWRGVGSPTRMGRVILPLATRQLGAEAIYQDARSIFASTIEDVEERNDLLNELNAGTSNEERLAVMLSEEFFSELSLSSSSLRLMAQAARMQQHAPLFARLADSPGLSNAGLDTQASVMVSAGRPIEAQELVLNELLDLEDLEGSDAESIMQAWSIVENESISKRLRTERPELLSQIQRLSGDSL